MLDWTLKTARKATSSAAACIYIKRCFLKPFFNWNAFIIQCLVHANHMTKYHLYYEGRKNNWTFTCSPTPSSPTIVHEPQHIYGLLQTHTTGSEHDKGLPRQRCRDEISQDQSEWSLSFNLSPKPFSKLGRFAEGKLSHRQVFLWYVLVSTHNTTSPLGHLWLTAIALANQGCL